MTLVPEHRPVFYVRCDDCLMISNTIVGHPETVLAYAKDDFGFVEVSKDPDAPVKHLCGDCAKNRTP